jgi:hypothetical protein
MFRRKPLVDCLSAIVNPKCMLEEQTHLPDFEAVAIAGTFSPGSEEAKRIYLTIVRIVYAR